MLLFHDIKNALFNTSPTHSAKEPKTTYGDALFSTFGPSTTSIPVGDQIAYFKLKGGQAIFTADVVYLDIHGSFLGVMNERRISSSHFMPIQNEYKYFALPFFQSSQNNQLQFRTKHLNNITLDALWQDKVVVESKFFEPFEAEGSNAFHNTGRLVDGFWESVSGIHSPEYMVYGPYFAGVPKGKSSAFFKLAIDNNSVDNSVVAIIDVMQTKNGVHSILASRSITRHEFLSTRVHYFQLNFEKPDIAGLIQYRTYWMGNSTLKQDKVIVVRQ